MPAESDVPSGWPTGFSDGEENRQAVALLLGLAGLLPRKLHALAHDVGTAAGCVAAVRAGRAGSQADRRYAADTDAAAVLDATHAMGARLVACGEQEYPPDLEDLADPPVGLFVKGRPLWAITPRVAIVGARRCTALGKEVATELGRGSAGAGVAVVSGAAAGIDSASHRGALAGRGDTIAVLGCGLDVVYPPGNAELLAKMAEAGALVSEYPPGTRPMPFHFPARNRIVVALAEALVVVEGAERSGSLISVEHALDLGRSVFAVPGPVTSPLSAAPLRLIREGATMIRGSADLLEDLGYGRAYSVAPPPHGLDEAERVVFEVVDGSVLPETIAASTGLSVPEAVAVLIRLELAGLVRSVGGRFERRLAASPQALEATEA